MSRPVALAVFLVSSGFLAYQYRPVRRRSAPTPPRSAAMIEPAPLFTGNEIERMRASLQDPSPDVRWAAAQLLFNIRDPRLGEILDKMVSDDPDAGVRIKIVGLMKGREDWVRLGGLVKGLSDVEKSVRIASLSAIGDIGDPSVSTWVTALLKDPEPDVRIAALRTLGRFQDKRLDDFRALAEKLRKDYENALRHEAESR